MANYDTAVLGIEPEIAKGWCAGGISALPNLVNRPNVERQKAVLKIEQTTDPVVLINDGAGLWHEVWIRSMLECFRQWWNLLNSRDHRPAVNEFTLLGAKEVDDSLSPLRMRYGSAEEMVERETVNISSGSQDHFQSLSRRLQPR